MAKLTIREKLGYSAGEIGSTISWQGMMFFLGYFYTDIFGLPAITAGYLLLFPRFFDAFFDPIVGVISDRTVTRWGKFRPYILWFFIPYSILMVLMYATPDLSLTGKTVYAYITYILMMVVYSLIMTPYNALGGVLTDDHQDRTSLQSYRFFMAFIGGIIIRLFMKPLTSFFGGYNSSTGVVANESKGYLITMIVFGILSLIAFYITFSSTKERIKPPVQQKTSLKQDFKDLMANKPWLILFGVSTLNLIYVGAWSSSFEYYFKYYFTSEFTLNLGFTKLDLMSVWNTFGAIVIAIILIFPTATWLSKKLGKRNTLVICFGLVAFSISGLFICSPNDLGLIFFFQLIQSAAAAATMPLVWSMYADAADYSEWKNNRRATGLVFSAVVLGQKAGIALGAAITMWVLGGLGYDQVMAKENPALMLQQNPQILTGIKFAISFIPGSIALLTTLLCLLYPVSNSQMDQIQADLANRRALQ
jgi:glycoside/pentoside/hexuronide:cation symporter, GPH family